MAELGDAVAEMTAMANRCEAAPSLTFPPPHSHNLSIAPPLLWHYRPRQPRRVRAQCLRLCNNSIQNIDSLEEVANTILKQPLGLRWIDLSFNEMTGLGEVRLLSPEEQIAMQFLHLTSIVSPH